MNFLYSPRTCWQALIAGVLAAGAMFCVMWIANKLINRRARRKWRGKEEGRT